MSKLPQTPEEALHALVNTKMCPFDSVDSEMFGDTVSDNPLIGESKILDCVVVVDGESVEFTDLDKDGEGHFVIYRLIRHM